MTPKIITGNSHADSRGSLLYNNDFDTSAIKRMFVIENHSTDFVRAWQGHKIEKRWYSAIKGSFKIQLIAVDNWESPTKNLERGSFIINAAQLDVLHIPQGYVSSIQSLEQGSRLLVMSDYFLAEIQDDFRYDMDYFR